MKLPVIEVIRPEKNSEFNGKYAVSIHAIKRMIQRDIDEETLIDVLTYGDIAVYGADTIFYIDMDTIDYYNKVWGHNIKKLYGIKVIIADRTIKTVYADTAIYVQDALKKKKKRYKDIKRVSAVEKEFSLCQN